MFEPPLKLGGKKDTTRVLFPEEMLLIEGASGVVKGVPDLARETEPTPAAFNDLITTGYDRPFCNPPIVKGEVVPLIDEKELILVEYS